MLRRWHFAVTLWVVLVATPAAAGGMHRCLGADGRISYSDRPCPTGQLSAGQVDRSGVRQPTKEEAAALKKAGATSPATPPGPAEKLRLDIAGPSLVATACSVLVVQCVQPPDKTLDGCFAAAPRCTSATPWLDGGSLACCPQSCLDQYKGLRKAGKPELQALQLTLPGVPGVVNACVAAPR